MKFATSVLAIIATWLVSFGQGAESNPTGCLNSSSIVEGKDYFPDKVTAEESEYWTITYSNTYKILTNEIQGTSYLLYQCGTEPPADEIDKHDAVISVPVQAVSITETPIIPHLELLGVRNKIVAYLGDSQYISSPCLLQNIANDVVLVIPDTSNATAVNTSLTSTANGKSLVSFITAYDVGMLNLTNEVVVSAYAESTNEGTFEWNKYISAFFNLEATSNEIYENVVDRYDCVAENAGTVLSDANVAKPVVLWAYYSIYSSGWSVAECPNYYCQFAEVCSADLLNSREGSIQGFGDDMLMTTDELVAFGKDADYWIFVSYDWDAIYANYTDQLDQLKSVQNKQVYDYQGSGEHAWFEERFAEFDVVAQDFCSVVGTNNGIHTRVWLRNVFDEEVGSQGTCTNVNAPLETQATECVVLPQQGQSNGSQSTSAAAVAFGKAMLLATLLVATIIM